MTECQKCGHKWNATKRTKKCPGCNTTNWNDPPSPAACNKSGGTCDYCGTEFLVFGIGNDIYCPKCGKKKWATHTAERVDDCHPWIMEKVKKGKTYEYWMASWREGDKVRNVHLGSCKKLDKEAAQQKARAIKKAALGIDPQ